NISSMAGYTPAEATTAYCVTKAGVLMLSECLRIELELHDIGVTAICPGLIDTPILRTARNRGFTDTDGARAEMTELFSKRGYTPERAASGILDAVQADRTVAPVAPEAWAFWLLKRLAPAVTLKLSGWLGRRAEARMRARG